MNDDKIFKQSIDLGTGNIKQQCYLAQRYLLWILSSVPSSTAKTLSREPTMISKQMGHCYTAIEKYEPNLTETAGGLGD